jgi:uncharacterized protein (TIGR02271 family)
MREVAMATLERERLLQQRGQDLYDNDGDKIGTIEEIYLDAETTEPEWALVNTGFFGTKSTFVPLQQATDEGGSIRVPYEKAQVKDAPKMDPDGQLSQEEEAELYRHYGLDYSESRSDSGLPEGGAATGTTSGGGTGEFAAGTEDTSSSRGESAGDDASGTVGRDVSGPTTDEAMTRSEEELQVGTTQREAGRARLRKYVVEDEVTRTVPVRREEVRVEREPITDANVDAATEGPAISDEEHEVVLHEEQPVVEKRVVPQERVRLNKDFRTEEETVSEEVRKERIEADGEGLR